MPRPPSAPSDARRTLRDATGKRYDRAYVDKWYRDPRHQVKSAADLARQVAFVVSAAELVLGRTIRSVLDVGCGEGQWRPALRRLRPRIHYDGVDASPYAVSTFGRRRRIQLGTIEALDDLELAPRYDVVLCVGMLNYLTPAQLRDGLAAVHRRTGGIAYLEIFTGADAVRGDFQAREARIPAFYRRVLRGARFLSIGMHLYVPEERRGDMAALELAPGV